MPMITKIQQAGTTYDLGIPSGLTEAQQAQIRANIGARAVSDNTVSVYREVVISPTNWTDNAFTAEIGGVTEDSNLLISPADASAAEYVAGGVAATAQAEGTITFTCMTTPTEAITIQILIL